MADFGVEELSPSSPSKKQRVSPAREEPELESRFEEMYRRLSANDLGMPMGFMKNAVEKLEGPAEMNRLQNASKVVLMNGDLEGRQP